MSGCRVCRRRPSRRPGLPASRSRRRRSATTSRRFVNLTWTLAVTDFKLSYFGSILGYVWSLVRPLLFFGVLYVVFTKIFQRRRGRPGLPGLPADRDHVLDLLPAGDRRLRAVPLGREGLLRKMRFPRLVIPVAVVLTALFNLATNFVAVLVFAFAERTYAAGDMARAARAGCCCLRSSRLASGCCCRCCTCASATSSRSGTSPRRCCSTLTPII